MTQAELSRNVRAVVTAFQKAGLTVTGAKVTFSQGAPVIEVSTAESAPSAPAQGGVNVEEFKEALDHASGVIRWIPSKGKRLGRRIVIPMTNGLRTTLASIPKRSTIILTNAHQRPWTVNGLAHAVNDALSEVGIKKRLHGLRRSAATYWASQGWSSRQIAMVMGWSEREAEDEDPTFLDAPKEWLADRPESDAIPTEHDVANATDRSGS